MPAQRLLLLHGVATTGAIWSAVVERLETIGGLEVLAPDRPMSGSLVEEAAWLSPHARDAVVVGFSGGATLGLVLAAGQVPVRAALLHEPAVGHFVPGLLAPVARAFEAQGPPGFGVALYGDTWSPSMMANEGEAVAREFAMFRAFEPQRARAGQGRVVTTVGTLSPEPRQQAARALQDELGYESWSLEGAGHFVAHDGPDILVAAVRRLLDELG